MNTVTKSIKRLGRRFQSTCKTEKRTMVIYQEDIDALNLIAEYIDETQKAIVKNNNLFTKLYIYLSGEFLRYYKCSAKDKIPHKEINRLLNTPMTNIVNDFKTRSEEQELYKIKDLEGFRKHEEKPIKYYYDNLKIQIAEALTNYK